MRRYLYFKRRSSSLDHELSSFSHFLCIAFSLTTDPACPEPLFPAASTAKPRDLLRSVDDRNAKDHFTFRLPFPKIWLTLPPFFLYLLWIAEPSREPQQILGARPLSPPRRLSSLLPVSANHFWQSVCLPLQRSLRQTRLRPGIFLFGVPPHLSLVSAIPTEHFFRFLMTGILCKLDPTPPVKTMFLSPIYRFALPSNISYKERWIYYPSIG